MNENQKAIVTGSALGGLILIMLVVSTLYVSDYRDLLRENPDAVAILLDYNSSNKLEIITRGHNWATSDEVLRWKYDEKYITLYSNSYVAAKSEWRILTKAGTLQRRNLSDGTPIEYLEENDRFIIRRTQNYISEHRLTEFQVFTKDMQISNFPDEHYVEFMPSTDKEYKLDWVIYELDLFPDQKQGLVEGCSIDFGYNTHIEWCNEVDNIDYVWLQNRSGVGTLYVHFKPKVGFQKYNVGLVDPPERESFKYNDSLDNDNVFVLTSSRESYGISPDGKYYVSVSLDNTALTEYNDVEFLLLFEKDLAEHFNIDEIYELVEVSVPVQTGYQDTPCKEVKTIVHDENGITEYMCVDDQHLCAEFEGCSTYKTPTYENRLQKRWVNIAKNEGLLVFEPSLSRLGYSSSIGGILATANSSKQYRLAISNSGKFDKHTYPIEFAIVAYSRSHPEIKSILDPEAGAYHVVEDFEDNWNYWITEPTTDGLQDGTQESVIVDTGSSSLHTSIDTSKSGTNEAGWAIGYTGLGSIDVSDTTGTTSGTPLSGTMTIAVYVIDIGNLSNIQLWVGTDASNHQRYVIDDSNLTDSAWVDVTIELKSGSTAGTPDWTDLNYARLQTNHIGGSGDYNLYYDNWYFGNPSAGASPDVNLNAPDGNQTITGSFTIDFNVSDADLESNNDGNLSVDIYYSDTKNAFQNTIVDDWNLFVAGRCDDTNFTDSTNCNYSWNTTLSTDGNWYIDIRVDDDTSTGVDFSESQFKLDNFTEILANTTDGAIEQWDNIGSNAYDLLDSDTNVSIRIGERGDNDSLGARQTAFYNCSSTTASFSVQGRANVRWNYATDGDGSRTYDISGISSCQSIEATGTITCGSDVGNCQALEYINTTGNVTVTALDSGDNVCIQASTNCTTGIEIIETASAIRGFFAFDTNNIGNLGLSGADLCLNLIDVNTDAGVCEGELQLIHIADWVGDLNIDTDWAYTSYGTVDSNIMHCTTLSGKVCFDVTSEVTNDRSNNRARSAFALVHSMEDDDGDTGFWTITSADATSNQPYISYETMDINVNYPDGNVGSFVSGSAIDINFSVMDSNRGSNDDGNLFADIYYSSSAGKFENAIVNDLNLFANCNGTNFTSNTECHYAWDSNIAADGNWYIDINLFENADANVFDSSNLSFIVDNNKPITSSDINSFWQSWNPTYTLTCFDFGGSGCKTTKYRLDSDSSDTVSLGSWTTYSSPVLISSDGNWAVDFNSTDYNGWIGDTNRVYILVDKTKPITAWDGNEETNDDLNVHLTCVDAISGTADASGCSKTRYRLDTLSSDAVNYGAWQDYDKNIYFWQDGNWAIDFNSSDKSRSVTNTDLNNYGDINTFYVFIYTAPRPKIYLRQPWNVSTYRKRIIEFDINQGLYDTDESKIQIKLNDVNVFDFNIAKDCVTIDINYHCKFPTWTLDQNGADYNLTIMVPDINSAYSDTNNEEFTWVDYDVNLVNTLSGYADNDDPMSIVPVGLVDQNVQPAGQTLTRSFYSLQNFGSLDVNICADINVTIPNDSNFAVDDDNVRAGSIDLNIVNVANLGTLSSGSDLNLWVWFDLNLLRTSFRSQKLWFRVWFSDGSTCQKNFVASDPITYTLQDTESFEVNTGDWNNTNDDDFNWTRDSGGTPSVGTGPDHGQDGNYYMFTESSSPNFPSKKANFEFDTNKSAYVLGGKVEFYYHMYGATMGDLNVGTYNGSTWTQQTNIHGQQHTATSDPYSFSSVTFPAGTTKIRFAGSTGSSFTSDMAIDLVTVYSRD